MSKSPLKNATQKNKPSKVTPLIEALREVFASRPKSRHRSEHVQKKEDTAPKLPKSIRF